MTLYIIVTRHDNKYIDCYNNIRDIPDNFMYDDVYYKIITRHLPN